MLRKLYIKMLAVKLFYYGWLLVFRLKFRRLVVDKILGAQGLHLKAPYTEWCITKDHRQIEFQYRYVYYWKGRKNVPFGRVYGKGIEIFKAPQFSTKSIVFDNNPIFKFETVEEYIVAMGKLDKDLKDIIKTFNKFHTDLSDLIKPEHIKTNFNA